MTTPAPSVPDFLAGYGPQQSDIYSLWTNAAAFFQQRVVFRANQTTTATTLPSSGAVTTIAYDNVLEDPYSGWNATTHQWTPPAGYSGWYMVTITVWLAAPGALQIVLSPYLGGNAAYYPYATAALSGSVCTSSPPGGAAEGVFCLWLTGGQDPVWGAAALANSAGNHLTNLTAGQNSSIEIVWIGS